MEEMYEEEAGWKLENSYTSLPDMFFESLNPTPVKAPTLIKINIALAELLGLDAEKLQSDAGIAVLAGNVLPKDSKPIAQAYAGHQFGYFTMLGDGRALLLGEQITSEGERFDIQLKGSGRTPYSRGGDGRAALGPMLREYIISEAMFSLGIPTTRSLAVVTTGEAVIRDDVLPGAILTRVAASHIRVGTFQYASHWGTKEGLKILTDYTLKRHFPEAGAQENRYLYFLKEVIKRQASLIAKWQLVGFIHGVMNTDNMSVCGETIDYGPCAFMDTYDPQTVFSSIDLEGRYAYGNQPYIASWNLSRFAEALLPLLDDDREEAIRLANDAIPEFSELYQTYWLSGMRKKLGLIENEPEDLSLIEEFIQMMYEYKADYTNTFRALTLGEYKDIDLFESPEFSVWQDKWLVRLKKQAGKEDISKQLMKNSNPAVIPRNYRVEEALDAAYRGDYSVMERLLEVLSNPYAYTPNQDEYARLTDTGSCGYKTFCGT